MIEIWNNIEGYEGLYQVSSLGRVKSLNYNKTGKEQILKEKTDRCGYKQIGLNKDGKKKMYRVHRLVAQAFIPNPENLPQVNHKDEDKSNNCVENLEWCSNEYNLNYGTRNERMAKSKINGKISKPILQYSLDGIFIKEFPSLMQIERELMFNVGNISSCCNGKRKQSNGYKWVYK